MLHWIDHALLGNLAAVAFDGAGFVVFASFNSQQAVGTYIQRGALGSGLSISGDASIRMRKPLDFTFNVNKLKQ